MLWTCFPSAIRRGLSFLLLIAPVLLLANFSNAQGLIVIESRAVVIPGPRTHFAFAPLEVRFHNVTVDIKDQIAKTSVEQEFYNSSNARLEGSYIFPLPAGAHIDQFQMDINGQMQQAELLDSGKAREYYEDIVRKMRDPALLEYAGRDAFRVRIFPIDPNSTKRVKVSYTQLLKSDNALTEYTYPLNTEKFSATPLQNVSVKVNIESKDSIKSVYSPSHAVSLRREGDHQAILGWEAHNFRPDTDFKVLFSRTQKAVGVDLLTYRRGSEDGYFLLLASPGMTAPRGTIQKKDVCFVIDTSGSMSEDHGRKIEQAKKSLSFCLQNLNKGDRFDVIRFSTDVEPLFGGMTDADCAHLNQAQDFVDRMQPIGATAIDEALRKALSTRPSHDGDDRPYQIIFITDGQPTVGETREENILANVSRSNTAGTRIFCFGLGTDVNTHLLDRLADQTNAISQYVLPEEDLEIKLGQFYTKIREPVLTNVDVKFEGRDIRVSQLYPNKLPDLFRGEMVILFGRYSGGGAGTVRISGTLNGEHNEFATDVRFDDGDVSNTFIPRLWATRRVGYLLDEIRLHGESTELKDEVTRLARQHGIVTPYTAYLILEDEKRRNVPLSMQSFSELNSDAAARSAVRDQYLSAENEAKDVQQQTGLSAINNSEALAQLRLSDNAAGPQQQAASLAKGQEQQAQESARRLAGGQGGGRGAFGGGAGGRGGGFASSAASNANAPAAQPSNFGYRQAQNYAQQSRVVGGRAFYQNGDTWTDSTAQQQSTRDKPLKEREIKFGSDEYFELLKKHPQAAEWFSLGDKVDVVIDGELIKIR